MFLIFIPLSSAQLHGFCVYEDGIGDGEKVNTIKKGSEKCMEV